MGGLAGGGGGGGGYLSLACFAGWSDEWHDVLVPLVGCPPKAQGMSSWKKCGMPVVKVWRRPSKKSARAGVAVSKATASAVTGQAKCKSQQILDINVASPELSGTTWFKPRHCPMSGGSFVGRPIVGTAIQMERSTNLKRPAQHNVMPAGGGNRRRGQSGGRDIPCPGRRCRARG